MDYKLVIVFIMLGYLIFGVISPFIRNHLRNKEGMPLENNLGGFLVKKIFNCGD